VDALPALLYLDRLVISVDNYGHDASIQQEWVFCSL